MSTSQLTLVEQYRKKLYRIAWRIQYRARVQTNHEFVMEKNEAVGTPSFTDSVNSKMYTLQLINSLPSEIGKTIIFDLYILDKTEAQIAGELKLSQQAVNKWKKKMLKELFRMLSSSNCSN
ncbi:sigma-70 family RNA polymerase sigma factor [Paenibacillus sp. BJ-4]|uniref:sigma-70 family RNA polymerase sigma factor n=1 Tax=Paenibacillus sp. BJ-4 TaxID=2878097 RepID=UPI001CF0BB59|nr:sigma-70 family RNA polymerase sigma factor [Paenibacillus sp. BJ-4]